MSPFCEVDFLDLSLFVFAFFVTFLLTCNLDSLFLASGGILLLGSADGESMTEPGLFSIFEAEEISLIFGFRLLVLGCSNDRLRSESSSD